MASHTQREKQICHINDVTPKKRNWKVLIQIVQKKKGGISRDLNNPARYRGYLFVDTMGTFVSAVCHGTDVAYFETTLLPGKRYYVSDVHVRPVRAGYEVGDYPFSWTLYSTASVHPLEETVPPPLPYDFQFKKFTEMFRFADHDTPMNVRGLVVGAFAEKKVGLDKYGRDLIAKDFVVVDNENIPMIMRLWKDKLNEYVDVLSDGLPEPIFFVAMNIKVTTFNGLSLSSMPNSVFLRDALVREAASLKEWYLSNKEDVDQFVPMKAYTDTNRLLRKPSRADIVPISVAMANLETTKTAWIAGKLSLMPGQERFWYIACKNCHTSLRQQDAYAELCPTCAATNPAVLMCHVAVTITDSDTAYAEIYSPNVELLIPFTADALKQADEEGRSVTNELQTALENKHVVCYIKYFDKLIRGAWIRKYPLTKIYLYDDVFPAIETPSKQSPKQSSTSSMMINEAAVDLTEDEDDDVQFFTPSMKGMIDQISGSTKTALAEVPDEAGCKRALSFSDVPRATAVVKIEPPDDDAAKQLTLASSSAAESPVKKAKTKPKKE